ncbi:MAG: protein kinase domain-containing protein [Myxococcota bacterium]
MEANDPLIGALVLGRYRIRAPLGEGGVGSVWLAGDEARDGAEVAVKVFPRSRSSVEEFRREAAVAMRTRHPNLVALLDAGAHEQRPVLILEYVPGIDARERLDRTALTPREAAGIGAQVFAALDALHQRGLVHGDIKPENVRLQGEVARVVDFGRARLAHVIDGDGMFAGTPAYMHPRLFSAGGPSPRTDCFAAWITTWELVTGQRPYTSGALRWADEGALPARAALPDPALDAIVDAGLAGRIPDARSAWLALARWLRGREDLPRAAPPCPEPPEDVLGTALARVAAGRSFAITGAPDATRACLEALHRRWPQGKGTVLWVRAEARSQEAPLSAALALAGHAADALDTNALHAVAEALGPLGAPLAAVLPSVRAWVPGGAAPSGRPASEQLGIALRRLLAAVPPPLLVLTDGLDRIDGSSRRFLGHLALARAGVVVASAAPGSAHGLGDELALDALGEDAPPVEPALSPVHAEVLAHARVLGLPFGETLARATGRSPEEVEDAALEAEAAGVARWTGHEVVARPGPAPGDEAVEAWFREAAARLDDPVLVARFARRGGDGRRLAEVLDAAVARVEILDPAAALELLADDPRAPTPERRMRHLRLALVARDMPLARTLLARILADPDVPEVDRWEAEGAVAFRMGLDRDARAAYGKVAAALGRPVRHGFWGAVQDVLTLVRVASGRPPRPRPHPRLANVLEHLYDLHFCNDQAPLLRLHSMWLAAAPDNPRARAMELIWRVALGRVESARQLERQLLEELREDTDPVGAGVVVFHRAIARLWQGEVVEAFADGTEASQRLMRAGDPYLAMLASSIMWTAGFHLAEAPAMARNAREMRALVSLTGDARGSAWLHGVAGLVAWLAGQSQDALEHVRRWADESAARDDSTEAVARRYLSELLLEAGDWRGARVELESAARLVAQHHLQMDFTEAYVLSALVADGMARRAGEAGDAGRAALARRARALVRRSPRWGPRMRVALGWQAAADGDTAGARQHFDDAEREALARQLPHDAWWSLRMRGMALREDAAFERAAALAARVGLKGGYPPDPASGRGSLPELHVSA